MGKHAPMLGQRFGRLTIKRLHSKTSHHRWQCLCDCGETTIVTTPKLKSGNTKSCGCLRLEMLRAPRPWQQKSEKAPKTWKSSREYGIWKGVIRRCYDPRGMGYHNYGGRGIRVCEQWRNDFQEFLRDMGPAPSRKHTIDRIDNDGDYAPGNCRWATKLQQDNNRRTNHKILYGGTTKTLTEWARELGIGAHRLSTRLSRGWTIEEAFTIKKSHRWNGRKGANDRRQ